MKLAATLCLVLLVSTAPAGAAGPSGAERLRLVFPQEGDTLNFARVRFAGSAGVNSTVRVQGRKVFVYPSGAFVGLVDMEPGWNSIVFSARDPLGVVRDTLHLYREAPVPDYPPRPTAVDASSITPAADVFIKAGRALRVEFRGSPGGRAKATLAGLTRSALRELSPRKAGGRRGVYRGEVHLPRELHPEEPLPIAIRFTGRDGHVFRFRAPGRVHVIPVNMPMIAVTTDSTNFLRKKIDGETAFELPAGIRLEVVEWDEGLSRVRLARDEEFFVPSGSLKRLPAGTAHPYASVGDLTATDSGDSLVVQLAVSAMTPFRVKQSVSKRRLEVSFYRAVRAQKWVYYPPHGTTLRKVTSSQRHGDVLRIDFHLNQKQQWGYRAEYVDGGFRLTIRKAPPLMPTVAKPLAGLRVVVDAGHGGAFEGVTGATGLREEGVNLDLARRVRRLLEALGARVVMTRNRDSTLTLQSRVALARRAGAHIFLSLHNNAVGANIDPLRFRGTSVYHTTPQSGDLSEKIYRRLQQLDLRTGGSKVEPYVVTRQTDMLSCLVEGAFLTHPEDEMLLLDMSFRQRLAQAVVDGLQDFIAEHLPAPKKPDLAGEDAPIQTGHFRSSEHPSR